MFDNLKEKMVVMTGRTTLKLKKYSPEILVGVGVVSFVGTVVLAANATLRVEEVIDNHKYKIEKVKYGIEDVEEYTKKDEQKDLFIVYTQTSIDLAKLYAPAALVGVMSVGCFLGAHTVMKKRNLAIMAAYKALESTFGDYRKRVVDKYGEDVDRNMKYGIGKEKVAFTETDEDGVKKKVKKEFETIDSEGLSEYTVLFNEQSSHMWSKTPGGNALYLKAQEAFANHTLHARGHVFLNEVYEWLGLPHTKAGAVVGWVRGNGDDYIDFGTYELNSQADVYDSYKADLDIVLDFNVDGLVYDLI